MPRLLFEKRGDAIWISHLDLMRLFQRAFKRAGLQLTHTQGFNPRPSVSIALPLSVGVESHCELLDFELDGDPVSCEEVLKKLNYALVPGIRVLDVYDHGRKLRDLALLQCHVLLEYDKGVQDAAEAEIRKLFDRDSLVVPKHTKNGMQDQDVIPMIQTLRINKEDDITLLLDCVACCQNPTLNPMQLPAAIERYLPEFKPDFAKCIRIEIMDGTKTIFR